MYQGINSTEHVRASTSSKLLSFIRVASGAVLRFAGVRENAALAIARINAGIVKVSLNSANKNRNIHLANYWHEGTKGKLH